MQQCREGRKDSEEGLTDSYLLSGSEPLECTYCPCQLTVKHMLVHCAVFVMFEHLFKNVNVSNIIDFAKETHFYVTYDVSLIYIRLKTLVLHSVTILGP